MGSEHGFACEGHPGLGFETEYCDGSCVSLDWVGTIQDEEE